jgi:hypothetical protein
MVTRQQIETIAQIIKERDDALLAYGGEGLTYADVQETNRNGWTIETSVSTAGLPHSGNQALDRLEGERRVLRTEGIVLGESDLRRAWDRAQALAV